MSLIIGRIPGERPKLITSFMGLIDPRKSSKRACQDVLSALGLVTPEAPLVRLPPTTVNTVGFGPVGSGKSSGLLIPFLLENTDPAIVVDFSGELARATMHARRKMGHHDVLLDPFRIVTKHPDRLNPLSHINPNSPDAIDECKSVGESLIFRQGTEHEPHWNDCAELFVSGFISLVVLRAVPEKRSLQLVNGLLSNPEFVKASMQAMCESGEWANLVARWGGRLKHPGDKERGSILSTVGRNLSFLDSIAVAESVSSTTFDVRFKGQKRTAYLIIPPDRIRNQVGLLRLWLNTLIMSVVKQGMSEDHKVHVCLDEAAVLGKMAVITQLVDQYRKFGLRAQFYYQSMGQLQRCWPEDHGQTLLSNATAIYMGVNDRITAEEISSRMGTYSVPIESWGENTGYSYSTPDGGPTMSNVGTSGTNWGSNSGWTQIARKLLNPDEVMRLPQRIAITFVPGMAPVLTHTIRYYEEAKAKRTMLKVKHMTLAVLMLCLSVVVWAATVENRPVKPQPKYTTTIFGEKVEWDSSQESRRSPVGSGTNSNTPSRTGRTK